MTTKEYLGQAYRLDQRIIQNLNRLPLSMIWQKNAPRHFRICLAIQVEINRDIDILVDLKRDIVRTIKAVENTEYQTILELRYLCFKTWEQIAVDMGYNVRHVYRIHDEAVNQIPGVREGIY